jgi:hypothetical protein
MRALPLLVLLAACDFDVRLENPGTTMRADATDDGMLEVEICPGPSFLFCSSGAFHVTVGNLTQPAMTSGFLDTALHADFAIDGAATLVKVTRDSDGAGASVTLPEPFTLAARVEPDGVHMRWRPSGRHETMHWQTTSCGDTYEDGDDVPDDAGEVFVPRPPKASCPVTITLRRVRAGTVDARFARGSSIEGAQRRAMTFWAAGGRGAH